MVKITRFSQFTRKLQRQKTVKLLKTLLGNSGWFISGSFANLAVSAPNDIDIFFYSELEYLQAVAKVKAIVDEDYILNSPYAFSFYIEEITLPVQLINKHFGTPEEVFNTFDLNICKRCILPDGSYYEDKEAQKPLTINNINHGTFTRYIKYLKRTNNDTITTYVHTLIDTYIGNNNIVDEYYGEKHIQLPVNMLLFNQIKMYNDYSSYLYKKASEEAPELLL